MTHAVVVDAANVVGSRPDGWWRDRAGAARRLRAELEAWLTAGPADIDAVVMVVEGAARPVARDGGGLVRIVAAAGSGDDTILDTAAELAAGEIPVIVVTADRELRERVRAVGATTESPSWLWSRLNAG
jgi:hypothetical protein